MVCRDVLALLDHKSLVNGLEPVGDMLMSLLAYTAWTSPNVWTRTAHCSVTLSATPSSQASEVPTQAGGSTVADVPCSTEAHTRFCDVHVLDGDAVSVPRASLSSSPTAPSVQTEMGYPWDRCGMSCKLSPVRSHGLKPERVESYKRKIQNCTCAKHPMWRLSGARRTRSATRVREKENGWSKRHC